MAKNYFGLTDTGKMRQNNEDTFFAQTLNNGIIAACVIDGVGGYKGGEVAASLAHDAILNVLQKPGADITAKMTEAFAAANDKIHNDKKTNKDNDQMACVVTLALADVNNNKFHYAHVGDTRLYLLRDRTLVKITKDHSFVGFLEDSGRLNEESAMRHPKRNEINKALGFDTSINMEGYIETGDSPFLPGDILLLCSDGLTDMVSNSGMTDILNSDKSLEQKAEELISAANASGGKDNITVVLVHNNKPATKQEATRPVAVKRNEATAVTEPAKNTTKKPTIMEEKKRGSTVPILSILCLILLAAFLYVLYQNYQNSKEHKNEVVSPSERKKRSEQEQKLIDSLKKNTTNEIFVLNMSDGQPISITDSLVVNQDSLHIIGNGVTLVGDSSYKGAALVIAPTCKYLLLDSLTLENFDIGVLAQNTGLHLRNVQFKNCRAPVQYIYSFANNTPINGRLTDTLFYQTDTLPGNR